MIADIKAAALLGAATTGLGLLIGLGASTASAQSPRPPATFTCPGDSGTHFFPDPDDSNAFYTCKNGQQTTHDQCPSVTKLILANRPECEQTPDDDAHP